MTHHDTTARPASDADAELAHVEQAFNRAMVSNDIERIRACITDDWVLVTPEVGRVSAERILHVIATGELRHDTMTKDAGRVRVYGDMAVVTARGQNTGEFRGQPKSADEWVTDVYRRIRRAVALRADAPHAGRTSSAGRTAMTCEHRPTIPPA